jgi:hypothetical protein
MALLDIPLDRITYVWRVSVQKREADNYHPTAERYPKDGMDK